MVKTTEVSRRLETLTDGRGRIAPILIRVPMVRVVPRSGAASGTTKARRRLRREVRQAGSLLILVATLALGYWAGSRTDSPLPSRLSESSLPPVITLSLEPIAAHVEIEHDTVVAVPVELQATLLPVDASEDQAHEER